MPKNITGAQAGTVQQNAVNDPSVNYLRGRNLFPQSFMHPTTCRYGEVDLVSAIKCERGDILPYKFVTDLNTFTMASPLKSEVNMMSAAFKVPMFALYPRNWDIMRPFPNKGDDVPDDTRALFSPGKFAQALNAGIVRALQNPSNASYNLLVRNVFLLESVYSAGSIFAKCNMHFCATKFPVLRENISTDPNSFDRYFDSYFADWLQNALFESTLSHYDAETPDYKVTIDPNLVGTKFSQNGYYITMRRGFELIRSGEYYLTYLGTLSDIFVSFPRWVVTGNTAYFNIESVLSYKAACVHFFTNPKVDYVYSLELFRDTQQSLVYGEDGPVPTFVWNGINKQYDVFSKRVFDDATTVLSDFDDSSYFDHSSFWFNLFSWSRSLRYGDYFTGVHPEPLAVGDVNAPVTDSSVNAIDMVEKIQLARLLNKVNIAGPRNDDQLVAMYGGPLPEAPKDVPVRLSLEKFTVTGFEVNNTADLQAESIEDSSKNITTTNLRLTDSRFMFEAAFDEPCWVVLVQYFEAHRIYSNTLDRFAFHRDRFDDFQPDLQYIGDQEVYTQELDAANGSEVPFAYNLRNMEYKQRYSYASGGFIEYLPSWLFITDNRDGNPPMPNITPDYIRSSPSEFDRFYKSLMGWSLASYFHFITTNTNVVAPYRQMVYAPEILA